MSFPFDCKPLLTAMGLGLCAMVAACAAPTTPIAPNADGEVIAANEAQDIAAVVTGIKALVQKGYDAEGRAFRDAHRKSHGCVVARFTVLGGLPANLAQGVLARPRSFDAVIRYSNGSQNVDDTKGDARGMAIKLMGVDGPKLLGDEAGARTQDFLLMTSPVFFVRNAKDYVGFQQAISSGGLSVAGWLAWHWREASVLLSIQNRKMSNPLNGRYWSPTPSRLGAGQQVKYSATPCAGQTFTDTASGVDLLGQNLTAHLAQRSACFDFSVQRRTQPTQMPIEDATVEWKESAAPFVKVARIDIAAQSPEQGQACDVRSFTPWHSIAEHRPLGGIERTRKAVYQAISTLRHDLNGEPRVEP